MTAPYGMKIRKGQGALWNDRNETNRQLRTGGGFREKMGPRLLGMGALTGNGTDAAARARLVGAIASAQNTPTYNVPTIDSVTLHFDGPLTDAAIGATFADVIDPLGANIASPPPGCTQVDSTFAEPGKFQTFALVCGIQWRLDIEPVEFTAPINGWTAPTSSSPKPVSPDVFSVADLATNGTLGLGAGQTMVPGQLEWTTWITEAFFHMVRGYNLRWQYGHNYNIINDTLRYTAFLPSNAQLGSASNSEVDIDYYLRRTNDYYRDVLESPFTALSVDHIRLGNMTLGEAAGLSVFKPSRAYERVGATYGGGSVHPMLKGNTEFRKLTVPFLAWPGVPLGLKAQVQSSDDQQLMQKYLSATYGFGGAPPAQFTEDVNVAIGNNVAQITSGVTQQEPSLDSPSAPEFVRMLSQRMPFKGGGFKITVAFKGYELTPDQASMVQNPDVRAAIQSECGCGMGVPGT